MAATTTKNATRTPTMRINKLSAYLQLTRIPMVLVCEGKYLVHIRGKLILRKIFPRWGSIRDRGLANKMGKVTQISSRHRIWITNKSSITHVKKKSKIVTSKIFLAVHPRDKFHKLNFPALKKIVIWYYLSF